MKLKIPNIINKILIEVHVYLKIYLMLILPEYIIQ